MVAAESITEVLNKALAARSTRSRGVDISVSDTRNRIRELWLNTETPADQSIPGDPVADQKVVHEPPEGGAVLPHCRSSLVQAPSHDCDEIRCSTAWHRRQSMTHSRRPREYSRQGNFLDAAFALLGCHDDRAIISQSLIPPFLIRRLCVRSSGKHQGRTERPQTNTPRPSVIHATPPVGLWDRTFRSGKFRFCWVERSRHMTRRTSQNHGRSSDWRRQVYSGQRRAPGCHGKNSGGAEFDNIRVDLIHGAAGLAA